MNECEKGQTRLRVGIIVDSLDLSERTLSLLRLANESSEYEVTSLIVQRTAISPNLDFKRIARSVRIRGVAKSMSRAGFTLMVRLEKLFLSVYEPSPNLEEADPIDYGSLDKIFVSPEISQSGIVYRYLDSDLQKIRQKKLDLLIRAGTGVLKGDILKLCPYGVLSPHLGDNEHYRGSPPGFWEIMHKNPRSGFIIQRLSEELDGGEVLFKGFVSTSPILNKTWSRLEKAAVFYMHRTLENLARKQSSGVPINEKPYFGPLYSIPQIHHQVRYLLRLMKLGLSRMGKKFFAVKRTWNVGLQFTEDWRGAVLRKSQIIPNPKRHFFADPFVYFANGIHYCFVEDFDISAGKGSIRLFKVSPRSVETLGIVLEEPFHLAFPYVFSHNGETFMVPDSSSSNDIRLYVATDFPLKWELRRILMDGVEAKDTTIQFRNGTWWLMTAISHYGQDTTSGEMHVFHSRHLESEDWIPHEANPVVFDPLLGRNGGNISDQTESYRVFQVPGFATYGRTIGVSVIEELTPQSYSEKVLFQSSEYPFHGVDRLHTFSYDSGLLAFDFARPNFRNGWGRFPQQSLPAPPDPNTTTSQQ